MPEEQSPTFMINGVLGELAAEVEATEARGVEQDEGSSSTPDKDDSKGDGADDENKIDYAPAKYIEQQVEVQDK